MLDVCVALTERPDEDEQMRQVVKRISLPADADPGRLDRAGRHQDRPRADPGRAIVNSSQPRGRDATSSTPWPLAAHGACLIALTIDEVGMAKTADRKVEIARRITEMVCEEHGLDREALIFDDSPSP